MKKYFLEFLKRGLMAAAGGPVVLAIVYGILGYCQQIDVLSVEEVTAGILSVTLMAFIASGITMIYSVEQLALPYAILIHGGVLYADYLFMYLFNRWIPRNAFGIGLFTAIFVVGFALIWFLIYLSIRYNTCKINRKLEKTVKKLKHS